MPPFETLVDLLTSRKDIRSKGITFIENHQEEDFVSYNMLYRKSLRALAVLQKRGINPKDELVFQVEDNKSFVILFWACILGGIIPVPLSIGRNDAHKRKLFLVWKRLNRPYLASSCNLLSQLKVFAKTNGYKQTIARFKRTHVDVGLVFEEKENGNVYKAKADEIAFIQFSSGSTGTPKGVILTHKNLITNISAIAATAKYSESDTLLSWMPLTHDMGMIGFHINPLYCGIQHYIIPTSSFVRMPALWFDSVTRYNATVIGSPNFGYSYVLKHCRGKKQNWDLSSVRILYNGAEPISAGLCDEFLHYMELYALKRNAMCPVYGLAEATLAVSISGLKDNIISYSFQRNKLNIGDKISLANRKEGSVAIVNLGSSIPNCEIQIVDHSNSRLPDKTIGHVWIKGESVTKGYYNNSEATKRVLNNDTWLDTGDIGFMDNKSLFITGRAKDIIFVNGQNYYPHDIEKIAEGVEGVELNKIAVLGCYDERSQEEKIVSFVFYRGKMEDFVILSNQIKKLVNQEIGLEINRVLPVKSIPRTTSGKLQRFRLLKEYLQGKYEDLEYKLERLSQIKETQTVELPTNEIEKRIASIWKKVLKLERVGVHQSFFQIGGSSLKLGEMTMELQKEFSVQLPFATFYEMKTIRGISEGIHTLEKKKYAPIPNNTTVSEYPLSFSQKRLYYAWLLDKSSTAYNVPVAYSIEGALNIPRLESSICELIDRHALLRARFIQKTAPILTITEVRPFALIVDSCTPENLDAFLNQLITPFDLEAGLLFRAQLIVLDEKRTVLFLDFHHIVADGLSVKLFLEELLTIYFDKPIDNIPFAYSDYVFWQQKEMQTENLISQEHFWLNFLKEEIPALELPYDNPRPQRLTAEGKKIQFQIGKENSERLRKLAIAHHTTIHNLLLSIYKWFLTKLNGQYQQVIGIPTTGRTHPSLQRMFGMFVNNLAIKVETLKNESFLDSLKRDVYIINQALNNQEYPYTQLVEKLNWGNELSRNPLFDTMFLFPPNDLNVTTKNLHLERYFFDPGHSKFDVSLEVLDKEDIVGAFEFATALFKETTILRFSEYFKNLVNQLVVAPETVFSEASLLSQKEVVAHLQLSNLTMGLTNWSENETVISLFQNQASLKPDKTALEFGSGKMNFKDLDYYAESFKLHLKQCGISEGEVVSVCVKRSPELVVALLGIFKLGAVYLPIEFDTPEERIKYIILDSKSKILVCDSQEQKFKDLEVEKIAVQWNTSLRQANGQDRSNHLPNTPAYIIYTSGTTGNPKAVVISHNALMNYLDWSYSTYLEDKPATFALFTSIGVDLTLTSVFLPLISGNKIVIYENEQEDALVTIFKENKVTHLKLTPSHMKLVINNEFPFTPTNLEKLIVGGELLVSDTAIRFDELFDQNLTIYNEYGPTEATIGCMIHVFDPNQEEGAVPIGRPIANCNIYLLDEFLQPVPTGAVGELYISGDCLADGYLYNSALTDEKFISNPFIDNQLMYRSGDLAKRTPSGIIHYVGRIDTQIKIRGFRIELEEVRKQILQYEGIREVVIASKETRPGALDLYAFYISDAGISPVALKSFLLKKNPHYMIPTFFVEIDEIPLEKNGKVHTKRLFEFKRKREQKKTKQGAEFYQVLIFVYQEIFEESGITSESNFYELGGDSIKATQIASRLFQKGIKVSPKTVLTYNTIEQLAYYIEINKKYEQNTISLHQSSLTGQKGTTPIEQWFLNHDFNNPNFYNQSILLNLKRKVKVKALEEVFSKLVNHHDGLRLNLNKKDQVLFFNENHLNKDFVIESFSFRSSQELAVILETSKSRFNIQKSLLIKAILLIDQSRSPNRELLFITAHHLVIDGVSWRILLEDIYTMCRALLKNKKYHLPQKTTSLIAFKNELDRYIKEKEIHKEDRFWEEIQEAKFTIPLDFETQEWTIENTTALFGIFDKKSTAWLLTDSHHFSVDIQILLHVAIAMALKFWSNTSNVKIEIENHGRHLEGVDLSRTIGWFTIMHPIIFQLSDDLKENIKVVKETLAKIPNHGIGSSLLNSKSTSNAISAEPSEVRFNYLGQFGRELSNDLFTLERFSTGKESAQENRMTTKLEINAIVIDGVLQMEYLFNAKAHKKGTIENLSESFFAHLRVLIDFLKNNDDSLLTPSDFDTANISQQELDSLFE
ncbi:MAG: amino acid adenylation domain-containing protein [Bacteroidota bacterium]